MQRDRIVAAACGSQRIVVASYRKEPGGNCWLEAAQVREVPAGSDWLGELVLALSDPRWELRRPVRLVVSPPPEVVWLKSVRLPRLDAAPRSAVLRFELEQATPFPPGSVTGASILAARGETEHEHLLCVLKLDLAHRIATALGSTPCPARLVPLGARLPLIVAPPPASASAALAVVDPACTLVALGHAHGVAVRAIAHARMPLDPPDRQAAQIASDIARAIALLRQQSGAAGVQEVRVGGASPLSAAVSAALRIRLELPVLEFATAEVMSAAAVCAPELAGTLALARGECEGVEPIDLTPPAMRLSRTQRPRRRLWAASAALLLLGAGVVAASLQLDLSAAERRVAKLDRELSPLRALASERRAHQARLEDTRRKSAALAQLERVRVQSGALLEVLGRTLEESDGAWIEQLEWRDASAYPPAPRPPGPTEASPPPHLRITGVVPVVERDRHVALLQARTLVRRLASQLPFRGVEFERFDDRHRDGVAFEADFDLRWEDAP